MGHAQKLLTLESRRCSFQAGMEALVLYVYHGRAVLLFVVYRGNSHISSHMFTTCRLMRSDPQTGQSPSFIYTRAGVNVVFLPSSAFCTLLSCGHAQAKALCAFLTCRNDWLNAALLTVQSDSLTAACIWAARCVFPKDSSPFRPNLPFGRRALAASRPKPTQSQV